MNDNKVQRWVDAHRQLVRAAALPVTPDDDFQALIREAQTSYVRLNDAETIRMADLAKTGTPEAKVFAHDMLVRNAFPVLLEVAFDFSTRFGGLLEAVDGALHLLNRLLPRRTEQKDGSTRDSGWDPARSGVRWLAWVSFKLPAEMPTAAVRLVDEKRVSGAPAAIAAGRSRLLGAVGNDASLRDEFLWTGEALKGCLIHMTLPKGRKNLVVKRGKGRFTARTLTAALHDLSSKSVFTPAVPEAQVVTLPITADWVARAVRANAREVLRRPNLGERTLREALSLSRVGDEWVGRNARTHRLDATVGEDGDERLADILPGLPDEQGRFEAPLHRIDAARALSAYRKYGPLYGDILVRLPVRQLLPVHRRRLAERQVRVAFGGFLHRAHLSGHGEAAIAAARLAAQLLEVDASAPACELRLAFQGVQRALRGSRAPKPAGLLGLTLAAALTGTVLAPVNPEDVKVARALRATFTDLQWGFSLAAALVFGRKLGRHGKADRMFVEACRKAGVRIRLAEEALNLLKDVPVAVHSGTRVRVQGAKGYVRPLQLALEAEAHRYGAHADRMGRNAQELRAHVTQLEAQAETGDLDTWLDSLDQLSVSKAELTRQQACTDLLAATAAEIEDSCTTFALGRVLLASVQADDVLEEEHALRNQGQWWADAYLALPAAVSA